MSTLASVAARNNAEWCDAVCRTHGIPGTFGPTAWTNARRTPQFYPDAVTLDAAASEAHILDAVDTASPGCSVKDSFASLDLSSAGFRVLFEAEWIHRPGGCAPPVEDANLRWTRVLDGAALATWEATWDEDASTSGLFRPALLHQEGVVVLGGYQGDHIVAGAIAYRSDDESVVGVSNLFAKVGDVPAAWTGCLGAITAHFPESSIVGYEGGAALIAAHGHGFTSVGPLRVWIKDG